MRSTNSMKNTIVAVILNIVNVLMSLITQVIFTRILGKELLGINGLFTNIISMLAIAELGIGSAIIYHLYKPIADKDNEKIKSLMEFYKKSYRIIAVIVTVLGICVIPFLKSIVGPTSVQISLYIIYALFLTDAVASYLLSYKRSILYANEKTYVVNIIHIAYIVIMNILQIIFLFATKNYIIYLIIRVILRLAENIVISIVVDRRYPFIKDKNIKKLDNKIVADIIKKIKGLVFHKVGSFAVTGSDSIILSTFCGVSAVGIYSNYNMVLLAIEAFFTQIFSALTASIGNLLIEKNKEKTYETYKKLQLFNFWITGFCAVSFYNIITPFIKLLYGDTYLLPEIVTIVITIKFYAQNMKKCIISFKEAAGIFHVDRFMPVLEAIVNIIVSVILVQFFGIAGVFVGTIISSLVLYCYAFPKYTYKPLFGKSYKVYAKEKLYYFSIFILSLIITSIIVKPIIVENLILQIIINGVLCLIIPNIIYILIFRKKEEYLYFKDMLLGFKFIKQLKNS